MKGQIQSDRRARCEMLAARTDAVQNSERSNQLFNASNRGKSWTCSLTPCPRMEQVPGNFYFLTNQLSVGDYCEANA